MSTIYPPYVIERSSRGERSYDIFSRLLMDRIVFLGTPINDDVANIIIAQLLFLDADNPDRTSTCISIPPAAACRRAWRSTTRCSSCGAREHDVHGASRRQHGLLSCSPRAARASGSALPHSRIMMHQPSGGAQGTAADIEIQAKEILYLRAKMHELMSKHTGRRSSRSSVTLSGTITCRPKKPNYGLIDNVVSQRGDVVEPSKQPTLLHDFAPRSDSS